MVRQSGTFELWGIQTGRASRRFVQEDHDGPWRAWQLQASRFLQLDTTYTQNNDVKMRQRQEIDPYVDNRIDPYVDNWIELYVDNTLRW